MKEECMADQIVWKVMPDSDEIEQIRVASETFDGVSQMLPGGSYTTFRTYNSNRVVRFCDHLTRLHTTAKLIERNNFPMDQEKIRRVLRKVISLFPGEEHRFRITVDLEVTPGTVLYRSGEAVSAALIFIPARCQDRHPSHPSHKP
jgi:hypothetical protein